MQNFFSLAYWFSTRPGSLNPIGLWILVILLFLLLFFSLLFGLFKKQKKGPLYKLWSRLQSFSIANTVIALFILFFMYEALPIFSSRFWLLVWLLEIVIWFYFIGKYAKTIPQIKEDFAKKQEFNKYIPK